MRFEVPILNVLRIALERSGYRVLCAPDGVEGIKVYAENVVDISVVITDINMPFMDGTALISALKKMKPSIKVIATTGMTSEASINAITLLGVERIIAKPCGSQPILLALNEVLIGPAGGSNPLRELTISRANGV